MSKSVGRGHYAVIFSSHRRAAGAGDGYAEMADRMLELAAQQDGFLGVNSVRDGEGFGITVSYWRDREAIQAWREQAEHSGARQQGRERWYQDFELQIARIEHAYEFVVNPEIEPLLQPQR